MHKSLHINLLAIRTANLKAGLIYFMVYYEQTARQCFTSNLNNNTSMHATTNQRTLDLATPPTVFISGR